MAWQRKEKKLSPEEAIELAKKELAPFWLKSVPRLAPVRQANGTVSVHPLDADFLKQDWLLYFLDPTDFSGEMMLALLNEWHRRYAFKEIGMIAVLRVRYSFLKSKEAFDNLLGKTPIPCPVVLDAEGLLAESFGVKKWPAVLLMNHGKTLGLFERGAIFEKGEKELQTFFRKNDPGLPLEPPLKTLENSRKDLVEWDMADDRLYTGIKFQSSNPEVPNAPRIARFKISGPESYPDKGFEIVGNWVNDGARIITADRQAAIRFKSPGRFCSIIAQSLARDAASKAEIVFELDGKPVFDAAIGPDLKMAEDGQTVFRPMMPRLGHVLVNMPAKSRNVCLRFPSADEAAVAIYGLRIGD